MRRQMLEAALCEIRDKFILEAATPKQHRRPIWISAVAAVLALILLWNGSGISLALQAKAVSTADYPKYEWIYRAKEMDAARSTLSEFFSSSLHASLSNSCNKNLAYSPLNLYLSLSFAAELSGSTSQQQILSLLNADSLESLRTQANQVWNASYLDDHNQTLLANSLWLDKDLQYDQSVMDTLAANYYTSVYQSDLGTTRSNRAIQNWLNDQTSGFLKEEVRNAGINSEPGTFPVLALYSTIFFRAKWSNNVRFRVSDNTSGIFHAPDGDITATYMNKQELQTAYYWGSTFGAVSLSMKDGSDMWLILPDEGQTVDDVLSDGQYLAMVLEPGTYQGEDKNSKYMKVNLSLPKFDIRSGGDLRSDLASMGITDIFDEKCANLSPSVSGDYPVWLSTVNQATRVAIDEEGVTAASYIEIPGAGSAAPPEDIIDFILDRPFIFVITNRYCLPLFAGVVNCP